LVIARARTDWVDTPPVVLRLWVDVRVTVDLTRRCLKYFAPKALCQTQHVDRAVHRGLCRLHRIALIMNGRCWAGQVVDFVDFDVERKRHVMPDQFKLSAVEEVLDVPFGASEKIVEAEHLVAFQQESLAQMGAKEPSSTSYEHRLCHESPAL